MFQAFKSRIAADGAYNAVWATQTGCIGVCPKAGATVATYPEQTLLTEVEVADVPALYEEIASKVGGLTKGKNGR